MIGIATLAVAYVLSQFYRTFLAVLTPALSSDLGITNAELSIASGMWFVTFALMQIPIGIWLDLYGPRRTTAYLIGGCASAGAILLTLATGPWMVAVSMGLIGMGCAPVLMASVFIFAKTYSPGRLAVMTSWTMGIGTLGSVLGTAPLAMAVEAFGWRVVMLAVTVLTLVVSACILGLVQEPAREPSKNGDSVLSGYLQLFKIRALWFIIPICAVATIPSQAIRGLWAGPYLADVYHADAILIGEVTFFMAIALVAGAFLYGPLDTFFRTRKWVVFGGSLLMTITLTWLVFVPAAPVFHMTAALMVIGVCGGAYGVIIAHAKAFMPPHLVGRGVTLFNFFSIGGVGVTMFFTSAIFSTLASPEHPEWAYQILFSFFAFLVAMGLVAYFFSTDAAPDQSQQTNIEPVET